MVQARLDLLEVAMVARDNSRLDFAAGEGGRGSWTKSMVQSEDADDVDEAVG